MTLILTAPSNPGVASFTDASTITTSGGITFIKKRVQLADIQVAAGTTTVNFATAIPANALVVGAAAYVTTAMAGGGAATGEFRVQPSATLAWVMAETVGVTAGFQAPLVPTGNASGGYLDVALASFTPYALITADVNLNTLTTFDMTAYLFYTVLSGITAP
jgi:hypothetical protein